MSNEPNTANMRPLRVAIVGSGPSGFYAAEALLTRTTRPVSCDIYDRLPTPYGLVRGGVAPDHQHIKNVTRVFERTAVHPTCRFYGNVKLGRDIQNAELLRYYDAVIYAVGNESDRKLGLRGEDLPGCHSATAFVGWYNGHPDFTQHRFDLDVVSAVVIGMGNVAMDVTRVLARDPSELALTDIADYALQGLRSIQKLKDIYIVGRHGVAQAAFSPKEIKELGNLPHADLCADPRDIAPLEGKQAATEGWDVGTAQNIAYLLEKCKKPTQDKPRRIALKFLLSPVEFIAGPDGRVAAVKFEENELVPNGKGGHAARGVGRFTQLPAGLVLKAVGYKGVPLPGVPYDAKAGIIPNSEGRVLENTGTAQRVPGAYVVGWAKRGPSGLIGTNKVDSIATVEALLSDYHAAQATPWQAADPDPHAVTKLLDDRSVKHISFADWMRVNTEEQRRGAEHGKIREKFLDVEAVLKFLGKI